MKFKIAIVGLGKIAVDQHIPSLAKNEDFELSAIVSRNASVEGLDSFTCLDDMIKARPDITAVSICVPPQVRFDIAKLALKSGLNVMLEKPPGSTLAEVKALEDLAKEHNVSLFATWHSRYASGVALTKETLKKLKISKVEIIWKEDVRRWHPGQDWIWQPGGLGVFDPGINALSIVTEIMPESFYLTNGTLHIPENLHTPVAAELNFKTTSGVPIIADFDFLQTGPQTWDIIVETDEGVLSLTGGGRNVIFNGKTISNSEAAIPEYDSLYSMFVSLLINQKSDVDVTPLMHVADCFMLCQHMPTKPFIE